MGGGGGGGGAQDRKPSEDVARTDKGWDKGLL